MEEHLLDGTAPDRASSCSLQPPPQRLLPAPPQNETCSLLPPRENLLPLGWGQAPKARGITSLPGTEGPSSPNMPPVGGCQVVWCLCSGSCSPWRPCSHLAAVPSHCTVYRPPLPQGPSLCHLPSTSWEAHSSSQHSFWTGPISGVAQRAGHAGGTAGMGAGVPGCQGRVEVTFPSLSYMHISLPSLLVVLFFFFFFPSLSSCSLISC